MLYLKKIAIFPTQTKNQLFMKKLLCILILFCFLNCQDKNTTKLSYSQYEGETSKQLDSLDLIKKKKDSIESAERFQRMKEYNSMSESEKRKLRMSGVNSSNFMNYLSDYDGSFPPLVEYTKQNLHNPKTFEHLETGFIIREEYIEVKMVYRAENGFGALRKEAIVAAVDENGKLIEILRTIN